MLKLKKIAITGGVASGKSTVCKVFQDLGAIVVDADAIVHKLLSPDTDLGQQIIRLLGNEVLEHGALSRKRIADKVFKDPEALHALEQLLHPAVLRSIEELYKSACKAGKGRLFAVEIPLLYEIGQEDTYDAVIALVADEAVSRKRFCSSGHSQQEYESRMKRQWPTEKKAARADYTLTNNGSLDELKQNAAKLYNILKP